MNNLLSNLNTHFFERQLAGESISSFLWCAGIIIATFILKRPLAKGLTYICARIAERFTDKQHGDSLKSMINKPVESLVQIILFYIALNQLSLLLGHFVFHRSKGQNLQIGVSIGDIIDHIFLFLIIIFSAQIFTRIIDFIYYFLLDKAKQESNREKQQLLPLMKDVSKLLVFTMSLFWILGSVFHVNIPALITGLGIGGVAIALAAKESVENLFAAFTLLSDRPFQTGDTIKLGTLEGVIEQIGFRTTRLRNYDGSVHIIPNRKLVNETLENLTQRSTRRIKVLLNLNYEVSSDNLQKIIAELKNMLQQTPHVINGIEVNVDSFGETTFQLILIYHLPHPLNSATLLAVKQEVNLKAYEILDRFTNQKPVLGASINA